VSDSSSGSSDPAASSDSNSSGGVSANAQGNVKVDGNIVGRDSITTSNTTIAHVEHYHANEA
jgi:hypothetical protein